MVRIVLVEPEIPQNTGNIARLCVLTESELHLVGKLGFSINDYYLRRAGLDYWECLKVSYHESLHEFMSAERPERLYYLSTKARRLYTEVNYHWTDYLVLGSETRGLPQDLIESHPENSLKIPMWGTKPRSHNLSNSAAIVLYEALRQVRGF